MRLRRLLCTSLVAGAVIACPAGGAATSDKPDLVPLLPTSVTSQQPAPVFVDAFAMPGSLLYRFDSVLLNNGGALDIFRDTATGDVLQGIWQGGTPTSQPDPNKAPTGPGLTIEDRTTAAGASLLYTIADGHNHWHFAAAARYELDVPGAPTRIAAKVGFCMVDTYVRSVYFPYGYTGVGPNSWCAHLDPAATFVRMGISPSAGDYYPSEVAAQWVDITGLAPGQYTLRAIVNPYGFIDESNTGNNVIQDTRTIPGTTATPAARGLQAGSSAKIALAGTIVAPEIPARKDATCSLSIGSCYVKAKAKGPLTFAIVKAPDHGTVSITKHKKLNATATYTPAAGFRGADTFTYTVTDARHLTSAPATVTLTVS